MGRINIVIPEDIHRRMKAYCALQGIILEQFINDAVSAYVMQDRTTRRGKS